MIVNNATYYIIADGLDWAEGYSRFIGEEYNKVYNNLANQDFVTNLKVGAVPTNIVVNEMIGFMQTNQDSKLLGEDYHYDLQRTVMEAATVMNSSLVLLREMIFEEVRKEKYPHLPSRQSCIWVIPKDRETMQLRMEQLKTPRAKIFELSLTGRVHRASSELLETVSVSPMSMRKTAHLYWMGAMEKQTPFDDLIFEGFLKVVKVIDGSAMSNQ